MTTVTGLTAERMLAIEAAAVVDGDISGDNLILTRHDGTQINAGNVRGPQGPVGPIGSDLSVLAAATVLDVGMLNQIRAGRQLTAVDFTNMGLSAPAGLWNLSDLSDASGNGRALNNKGAVPFTNGIKGDPNTAARFSGAATQALYTADSGAADPLRLKNGSIGCWFKTGKRGTTQMLISKIGPLTNAGLHYQLYVGSNNTVAGDLGNGTGSAVSLEGTSDVADNRWHFAVMVFDTTLILLYVDGVLQQTATIVVPSYSTSAAPFNVGARGADASTAADSPFFGRVDEAFATIDVLSKDQIRNLYCVKIPHALAVRPTRASINISRRRRGAALVAGDFPTQPLRLHNFSAQSLGDSGVNNVGLTNNGAAVSVAGADGTNGNAFAFAGAQSLSATDAGLPSGLGTRSYGCWIKTNSLVLDTILGWGTLGTGDARIAKRANGTISLFSAANEINATFVADGKWHFIVGVEDNAAVDGLRRKLYVDGRLVGSSTVLTALVLAGANRFRMGAAPDATSPYTGQIDAAFVSDQALTADQIMVLYDKSVQTLPQSPKNAGDHIEGLTATDILAVFDTLETNSQIELGVAA